MSQRNPQPTKDVSSLTQPSLSLREQMSRDLKLNGKKQRTHDGYLREIRKLACFYNLPPDQLSQQQVGEYLLYLINDSQFAPGTLKVTYSASEVLLHLHLPTRLEGTHQAAGSQTEDAPRCVDPRRSPATDRRHSTTS